MYIGLGIRRAYGTSKLTGRALYVDDIHPEGCLHGATVRSAHAHARVTHIGWEPGFDSSGLELVTAADIPGQNVVYLMTRDQPALAEGLVRHVAEPIALVAAPTRARALAAVAHVKVEYEPLEALMDPELAEGHAQVIFGEDNVFSRIDIERGEVDEEQGGEVIEGVYSTGLHEQLYIEPQGMIAVPREDGGLLFVGSLQCPYYIVKGLTDLLGEGFETPDRINVIQAATGGGFGGKEEYPSMIAAHAALLALKTGRPVKLVYRRDEDLVATTKRHPTRVRIRTRVGEEGRLLSFEADVLVDGGAYNTLTPVVLSRAVLHATGPYACERIRISGRAVATHTPPNGAFRGFGAPQVQFACERHMDRIARVLGLDPIELRRRNLFREGDFTATGQRLMDPGADVVLEAALDAAAAGSDETSVRPPGAGEGVARLAQGRGVSLVFHGCGFTGNGEAALKGRVGLSLDGQTITVLTASTDIGQGTDTVFPQIVAEELGVPLSSVIVAPHDTAEVPDSGPTVASRTAMVVGGVCLKAAKSLRTALALEVGDSNASFTQLLERRSLSDVLHVEEEYVDDGQLQWDPETYQGDAYPTYGWSCSVVDISVDLDTGEVTYHRFVSATDVGRALNPVLASGQIEGGSLQALGWATCEEVIIDERGAMVNDRLTNYIIPTSLDAPEMETVLVEIPYEGGPFGAKGIGEIPMDGPAAAVAQAIENATGAVLDSLPMTPERVLEALS
ncbi:MAG: xanthine dehydrogenase family protein molybdopterin-binding subunit [Myxococcota bacterium]|nr:xanthine dehydrogenase family protein molybdopterin-binding subunit [Myxococcota bacterium]